MNGVQTELNCKPNVKRCKRFVFPEYSPLLYHNTLKTKAIKLFQADHILTRFVFPPLNGGGVGIGKAINGGFGMVCDGSERVDEILRSAMLWDVMGGVARRSWARNPHAMETSEAFNESHAGDYQITMPYVADEELIKKIVPSIVGK